MPQDNRTIYIILGLLSHEPMTGYEIKRRVTTTISFFWEVGYGQIYPALRQLQKDGLVTMKTEARENRPRKVYTITESGRTELKNWLHIPAIRESERHEILLKLFFGSQIPVQANLQNIASFRKRSAAVLETLTAFEENLRPITSNPDHLYYLLTVRFGEYLYKAYLDWVDEATATLQKFTSGEGHPPSGAEDAESLGLNTSQRK